MIPSAVLEGVRRDLELWLSERVDPEQRQFIKTVVKTLCRDFILAWAVRGGVGFLPQLLKAFRSRQFDVVQAVRMAFGKTAIRFGLFMSIYFALFKILERLIEKLRGKDDSWNAFLAGSLASIALIFEEESSRWTIAQYISVRALSSLSCSVSTKFPILKPLSYYGDAFVFALCSGQAVYNFVVRPETLDIAYSQFLTQVAQIHPKVIAMFRSRLRTGRLDSDMLASYVGEMASKGVKIPIESLHELSCSLIHPGQWCLERILWVWGANFRMVFPMYFSLHIIPPFLFKFKSSLHTLNDTILNGLRNTAQSSSFMATYVFIFQIVLCMQRTLIIDNRISESRYAYWITGFLSAASIFIEKKSRRSELALYMMPRAGVSLYRSLVEKGWARNVKFGEYLLFSLSMAVLMRSHRRDPSRLSSIVRRILNTFL